MAFNWCDCNRPDCTLSHNKPSGAELVLAEVAKEVERAISLHEPQHSPHESLGVIREEYIEFETEVFEFNLAKGRDTRPNMRKELIQLAATAIRAVLDNNL